MDFSILNPILNPIFNPLLTLVHDPNNPYFGAIIGVLIIATIIAFVITLANKLLVDQDCFTVPSRRNERISIRNDEGTEIR